MLVMKSWGQGLFALALALALLQRDSRADLKDCISATCRISSGGGIGTGIVFESGNGEVRILTNYHVAEGRTCKVEFWKRGHQSQPLQAASKWFAFSKGGDFKDLNVLAIPATAFGGSPPPAIRLGDERSELTAGMPVCSVGCPAGSWPTAWLGHVDKVEGPVMRFLPAPAGGRSGSGIFDENGTRIVGIVGWRDDAAGNGIAMTAGYIRSVMRGESRSWDVQITGRVVPVGSRRGVSCDCGPHCVCPPGDCYCYDDAGWHSIGWGDLGSGGSCPDGRCPPRRPNDGGQYQYDGDGRGSNGGSLGGGLYPSLPPESLPGPVAPYQPQQPASDYLTRGEAVALDREYRYRLGRIEGAVNELARREPATPDLGPVNQKLSQYETHLRELETDVSRVRRETVHVDAWNHKIDDLEKYTDDKTSESESRAKAAIRDLAGNLDGFTIGKAAASALGFGGPIGLGVGAVGWFLGRRVKRRVKTIIEHRSAPGGAGPSTFPAGPDASVVQPIRTVYYTDPDDDDD